MLHLPVIIIYVSLAVLVFGPLRYWLLHPEQTEMQIFLRFWWAPVSVLALTWLAAWAMRAEK